MVKAIENDIKKIEPLKMPIKIGNSSTSLLVDSESACSIFNQSLALQVVKRSPYTIWIHEKVSPQLRSFSIEPIHVDGKINSPVTSSGWTLNSATFNVVANSLKSLIGRDLFDQLGVAVTHSSSSQGNQVNSISSSSEFKEQNAKTFPNLISRIARSKNHVAISNFHEYFQPRLQKGRITPIDFQDKLNKELKKLLDEKYI